MFRFALSPRDCILGDRSTTVKGSPPHYFQPWVSEPDVEGLAPKLHHHMVKRKKSNSSCQQTGIVLTMSLKFFGY
jgi:hypothetical protein